MSDSGDAIKSLILQILPNAEQQPEIGGNTRFVEDLGFDSVKSIMLATLLESTFGLDLSKQTAQLLSLKNVGEVVEFIDASQGNE